MDIVGSDSAGTIYLKEESELIFKVSPLFFLFLFFNRCVTAYQKNLS